VGPLDEPVDHPQGPRPVVVVAVAGVPNQDVVVPEALDIRGVGAFDRIEHAIGDVGDGIGVGHRHLSLLTT